MNQLTLNFFQRYILTPRFDFMYKTASAITVIINVKLNKSKKKNQNIRFHVQT